MQELQPPTRTVKASEGRQLWSKMLNDVFRKKTRVVVERNEIPIAAIVSLDDLERLERIDEERESRFRILEDIGAAFADATPAELEREAADAVAAVRAETQPAGRPRKTD